MKKYNVWMAFSGQALDAFKERRAAERDGTVYLGPMDDATYEIMQKMSDTDTVQGLFKTHTANSKTYTLFSLYVSNAQKAQDAIDYITAKWPSHFIVVGAWNVSTGLQAGQSYDDEDVVTGDIAYPLNSNAYKLMPDVVEYDENGDVVSTTPAASNADLRDINLLTGQAPRAFA